MLKIPYEELKRRFKEYSLASELDLRGKLIQAVSLHEGTEESAVALVDEALMPVIDEHRFETVHPTAIQIMRMKNLLMDTHANIPDELRVAKTWDILAEAVLMSMKIAPKEVTDQFFKEINHDTFPRASA